MEDKQLIHNLRNQVAQLKKSNKNYKVMHRQMNNIIIKLQNELQLEKETNSAIGVEREIHGKEIQSLKKCLEAAVSIIHHYTKQQPKLEQDIFNSIKKYIDDNKII